MTDDDLPDRRKHGYAELEKKVDDHSAELDKRLSKFIKKSLIAFGIIGVATTIALLGFALSLHEIQDTRKQFVRDNCESTNSRHDTTYAALVAAAKIDEEHSTTKQGKVNVRRRRDVTLGLIDALQPHQDCTYLVQLAAGKVTPTPTPTLTK